VNVEKRVLIVLLSPLMNFSGKERKSKATKVYWG
jgi:hypothetical protein